MKTKIKDKNILWIGIIFVLLCSVIFVHAQGKFDVNSDMLKESGTISLKGENWIEQELQIGRGHISSINIEFGTYERQNDGELIVELYKDDRLIQKWSVHASLIPNKQYYSFKLPKALKINQSSKYSIKICEKFEGDNNLEVCTSVDNNTHYILEDNKNVNRSICYTITYRGMKKQILSLCFAFAILLLVSILVVLKVKEEMIMAIILAFLMGVYMWLCPLGMAPDEENHFLRAYEVSYVSLVSKHVEPRQAGGNLLPENIRDYKNKEARLDYDNLSEQEYSNTALYSPISYLPQAIGMKIAGIFSSKVSVLFWGGKVGNAVCAFVLCMLALWLVPFCKRILFILMTFPLSIQEMISISPDGFTIALCIFFFAFVIRLRYKTEKIKKKHIVILFVAGGMLALCKIVYVVLILLIFMVPNEKFQNRKQAYLLKWGCIAVVMLLNLVWLKISSGFLVEFNPGVDSGEQVKYILTNPLKYYEVLIKTMISSVQMWISTMTGTWMGALSIEITSVMWISALILLVYETTTCVADVDKVTIKDLITLLVVFLGGVILICTSLYVQWTPLRYDVIEGIQGRYFTPILASLLFFIILSRCKTNDRKIMKYTSKGRYCYLVIMFYNLITLFDMAYYYII